MPESVCVPAIVFDFSLAFRISRSYAWTMPYDSEAAKDDINYYDITVAAPFFLCSPCVANQLTTTRRRQSAPSTERKYADFVLNFAPQNWQVSIASSVAPAALVHARARVCVARKVVSRAARARVAWLCHKHVFPLSFRALRRVFTRSHQPIARRSERPKVNARKCDVARAPTRTLLALTHSLSLRCPAVQFTCTTRTKATFSSATA